MKTLSKRNQNIINLHNQGQTARQIEMQTGVSKSSVNRIVTNYLTSLKEPEQITPVKEAQKKPVTTSNKGERVFNFGEYTRTGVNEYSHKSTGEVINVKFVPAKNQNEFGYFVKA